MTIKPEKIRALINAAKEILDEINEDADVEAQLSDAAIENLHKALSEVEG